MITSPSDLHSDSSLGPSSSGSSFSSPASIVIDRSIFLDLSSDSTHPDIREVKRDEVMRGIEHPNPSSVESSVDTHSSVSMESDEESLYPNSATSSFADDNDYFADIEDSSDNVCRNNRRYCNVGISDGRNFNSSSSESSYNQYDPGFSLSNINGHDNTIDIDNEDDAKIQEIVDVDLEVDNDHHTEIQFNTKSYCNVGISGNGNFDPSSSESSYNPYDPGFSLRNINGHDITIDCDYEDHAEIQEIVDVDLDVDNDNLAKKQEVIDVDLDRSSIDVDDAKECVDIIDVDRDNIKECQIIDVDVDSVMERDIIFVGSTRAITRIITPQREECSFHTGMEYVSRFNNFKLQFIEHMGTLKRQNTKPLFGGHTVLRLLERTTSYFDQDSVYPDRMLDDRSMDPFLTELRFYLGIGPNTIFMQLIRYLSTDRVSNTTVFSFWWGNKNGLVLPHDFWEWKR